MESFTLVILTIIFLRFTQTELKNGDIEQKDGLHLRPQLQKMELFMLVLGIQDYMP